MTLSYFIFQVLCEKEEKKFYEDAQAVLSWRGGHPNFSLGSPLCSLNMKDLGIFVFVGINGPALDPSSLNVLSVLIPVRVKISPCRGDILFFFTISHVPVSPPQGCSDA